MNITVRQAFTLVELLVALGLVVFFLALIYQAAAGLHMQWVRTGRAIERTCAVYSALGLLHDDLASAPRAVPQWVQRTPHEIAWLLPNGGQIAWSFDEQRHCVRRSKKQKAGTGFDYRVILEAVDALVFVPEYMRDHVRSIGIQISCGGQTYQNVSFVGCTP